MPVNDEYYSAAMANGTALGSGSRERPRGKLPRSSSPPCQFGLSQGLVRRLNSGAMLELSALDAGCGGVIPSRRFSPSDTLAVASPFPRVGGVGEVVAGIEQAQALAEDARFV